MERTDDAARPTPLSDALTAEHHTIDKGIAAFVEAQSTGAPFEEWAAPLVDSMTALRRHIYLEEVIAFPPLKQGPLMMPIMVMLREHGELWREMDELDVLLTDAGSPDEMVAACERMLELLERHNEKEEPIIYPLLDSELSAAAQGDLQTFIETGSMPEGWVCERASR